MNDSQGCLTGAAPPDFPPGWAEFTIARRQFLLARGLQAPQPASRFVVTSERGEDKVRIEEDIPSTTMRWRATPSARRTSRQLSRSSSCWGSG